MAGGDKKKENDQTFSFETVAVLVAVLKDKGGNLGMKEYQLMASLDGGRSASGFDHLFRKVKARANELIEAKKANDDDASATTPKKANGSSKNGTQATGGGKSGTKRGRKNNTDEVADDEESPSKKVKAEVTEDGDADGTDNDAWS